MCSWVVLLQTDVTLVVPNEWHNVLAYDFVTLTYSGQIVVHFYQWGPPMCRDDTQKHNAAELRMRHCNVLQGGDIP